MDFSMIVTRTYDAEMIKSFMVSKDIWKTAAEDGQTTDAYNPDPFSSCWLAVKNGEKTIGLCEFKAINTVLLDMHPVILPEFRSGYANAAVISFMKWIYNNHPEYKKIIATVPVIYRNIKIFAKRIGFKEEGVNRKSYMKNGELVDQWIFGATRQEIGVM